MSGILTALDRYARPAPLFGVKAPQSRSGKSLYVDLIGILLDGCAVASIPEADKKELEKCINGALLAGDGLISIDNLSYTLRSSLICQAVTQGRASLRILGYTGQKKITVASMFVVNGNNLQLAGDLVNRLVEFTIDAMVEQPELREFSRPNLKKWALEHRGELVSAGLTALRAYHCHCASTGGSGLDEPLKVFGGFGVWTQRIRAPLVWLGWPDPWSSETAANDPDRENLETVLIEWVRALGASVEYRMQEVISAVNESDMGNLLSPWKWPDFRFAMMQVAGLAGELCPKQLARWLPDNRDKIVGGRVLRKSRRVNGQTFWKVDLV
jgi:hypothetical protein